MMSSVLRLEGICKRFGAVPVLAGIDIDVREGEFATFMGPSGCGKTTLLRIIGGFVTPDSGVVYLDGRNANAIPPFARDTAMVFQNGALFPHLSVAENIAFGLRVRRLPDRRIQDRVRELLALVQLEGTEDRAIDRLSGGQQQRVALARAFSLEPRVLLLDEPHSSLDANLRLSMREELRRLQRRLGLTTILVTHDQHEAMSVSDRIFVLNEGRIQQEGSPIDIYESPANAFVAQFVGSMNFIPGTIRAFDAASGCHRIETALGPLVVRGSGNTFAPGAAVTVGVRPEAIRIGGEELRAEPNAVAGRVDIAMYTGARIEYAVLAGAERLAVFVANPGRGRPHDGAVWVALPLEALVLAGHPS